MSFDRNYNTNGQNNQLVYSKNLTTTPLKSDAQAIVEALKLLTHEGQVVEVRAINATFTSDRSYKPYKRTISGYFNNLEMLATEVEKIGTAESIYFSLNPVKTALMGRAYNRLKECTAKDPTTSDKDIVARTLFFIDCDPQRPAKISSTEEEHQAALDRLNTVIAYLKTQGFSEPIIFDSGNGFHAQYRIDLPVNEGDLIKDLLEMVNGKFGDDSVGIDTTVFNPSRVCKLYGTPACKGDSIPDRPHRMSALYQAPVSFNITSQETLEAAVKEYREQKKITQANNQASKERHPYNGPNFNIEKWMEDHGLNVKQEKNRNDNQTIYLLEECPFDTSHTDNAAVIGVQSSGAIFFKCQHNSCSGKTWHDLRAKLEPERPQKGNGVYTKKVTPISDDKLPRDFILDCYYNAENGDSQLFAQLFQGKYVYDAQESQWFRFGTHSWYPDTGKTIVQDVMASLARTYGYLSADLTGDLAFENNSDEVKKARELIEGLRKRQAAVQTAKKVNSILALAATHPDFVVNAACEENSVEGIYNTIWDSDPYVIAFKNGVLNLKTRKFGPGKPEDYIRTVTPTLWKGIQEPCPLWEETLGQIFADRENPLEIINYLQQLLGYGITGLTTHHIFGVLAGSEGRNGKGVIIRRLQKAFGSHVFVANKDVVVSGERRTAGSAQQYKVELLKKRIVFVSETNEGERFDAGQVKELTGGDPINARGIHERKSIRFYPNHLLLLLTNEIPHASSDDSAFWSRMRVIQFNMRFLADPDPNNPLHRKEDVHLEEKLDKEISGIAAWFVRGCYSWMNGGFQTPESVIQTTKEVQSSEDTLAKFFDDCCVVLPNCKAKSSELYGAYKKWCDDGGMKYMSIVKFSQKMQRRFVQNEDRNRTKIFVGIGLKASGVTTPASASEAASEGILPGVAGGLFQLPANPRIGSTGGLKAPSAGGCGSFDLLQTHNQNGLTYSENRSQPPAPPANRSSTGLQSACGGCEETDVQPPATPEGVVVESTDVVIRKDVGLSNIVAESFSEDYHSEVDLLDE